MPELIITNREGEESRVDAEAGLSVMEAIREAGFDELVAMCGGCCSCATCHVIVEPGWIGKVGHAEGDELDLLESSDHRTETSRLSCQIPLTDALDGLRVRIAEED